MKKLRNILYTTLLFSNFTLASPWYGEVSYTGSNGSIGNFTGFDVDNTDDGWQLSFGYEVNNYFAVELGYFNLGEQKVERGPVMDAFIGTGTPIFFNPFSSQFFPIPPSTPGSQPRSIFDPVAVNLVSTNLPSSTTSLTFDTRGLRFAGVGKLPLSDWFSLNFQAGALITRYETTLRRSVVVGLTTNGSGSFTTIFENRKTTEKSIDPELFAGMGVTWRITSALGVELSWEKFLDVGDEDTFEQDIDTYNLAFQYHF